MENCSLRWRCLATDRAIQMRQLNLVPRVYTATILKWRLVARHFKRRRRPWGRSWRQLVTTFEVNQGIDKIGRPHSEVEITTVPFVHKNNQPFLVLGKRSISYKNSAEQTTPYENAENVNILGLSFEFVFFFFSSAHSMQIRVL